MSVFNAISTVLMLGSKRLENGFQNSKSLRAKIEGDIIMGLRYDGAL
jgi:hypothetical protein